MKALSSIPQWLTIVYHGIEILYQSYLDFPFYSYLCVYVCVCDMCVYLVLYISITCRFEYLPPQSRY